MSLLKAFGFYKSTYNGAGSYCCDYCDEACMKFTADDQAILEQLA